jgi:hypothetical protein
MRGRTKQVVDHSGVCQEPGLVGTVANFRRGCTLGFQVTLDHSLEWIVIDFADERVPRRADRYEEEAGYIVCR